MSTQVNQSFKVSAWHNSNPNMKSGAGYGIRIAKNDYHSIKNWKVIYIGNSKTKLERGKKVFKEKCPEIRSKIIGDYFIKLKKETWSKHEPYQYMLTHIGNNEFRLSK